MCHEVRVGLSIVTVVHVDDLFAVGLKARCGQFCEDLNRIVPINNLGELRWYAGCRFLRDWDAGKIPRRGIMLVLGGVTRFRLV